MTPRAGRRACVLAQLAQDGDASSERITNRRHVPSRSDRHAGQYVRPNNRSAPRRPSGIRRRRHSRRTGCCSPHRTVALHFQSRIKQQQIPQHSRINFIHFIHFSHTETCIHISKIQSTLEAFAHDRQQKTKSPQSNFIKESQRFQTHPAGQPDRDNHQNLGKSHPCTVAQYP